MSATNRKIRLVILALVLILGGFFLVHTLNSNDDFQLPDISLGASKEPEHSNTKIIKQEDVIADDKLKDDNEGKKLLESTNSGSVLAPAADAIKVGSTKPDVDNKDLTKQDKEEFNPAREFNEILAFAPVVIFSKVSCPYSQALKSLLTNDYEIVPQPIIVELDKHEHGKQLQEYIGKISGRTTVPNLFVKGTSRGGSDEMKALHEKGTLLDSLVAWGGKDLKVTKHSLPSNS